MSESLFKLTAQAQELIALASSSDADDAQIFADTLEALLGEIDSKSDDYCYVRTTLLGRLNTVSTEINRLKNIETSITNAVKRMELALKASMEATGRKEIQTDLHKIKIVKNGGVEPLKIDEGKVPENFMEIIQRPDKDKIRKALKDGAKLDFAHLEERGTRLKID